jgi:hypothetical protein
LPLEIVSWRDYDRLDDMVCRTDPMGNRGIYPFHEYPKVYDVPETVKRDIQQNLIDLKEIAER